MPKQTQTKLVLNNPSILKAIVETLAQIIDETNIIISPEGLIIKAMDPSRICLSQLEMVKNDWDEFKCSKKQTIGINLEDLDKILKRASKNDTIELTVNEETQKLGISMIYSENKKRRNFKLGLLDLKMEEIPIDNLLKIDFDASFVADLNILEEALKDAEIYAETITIKTTEDLLEFSALGQIGEMNYEIESENLEEYESAGETTGTYSIEFLKKILKLKSITEKLTIEFKTDHPFRLQFNIIEGGVMNFFLAPRVESVDFEEESEDELIEEMV